jgi:hypothetical protein
MRIYIVYFLALVLHFWSVAATETDFSQFYDPLPEYTSDRYEDYHAQRNTLKKHILFVSVPFPGHVNPLLAQAEELVDQGFTVTVATPSTLSDYINRAKDSRYATFCIVHFTI